MNVESIIVATLESPWEEESMDFIGSGSGSADESSGK